MADGNNMRCFNAECRCGCQKEPHEMTQAFRKRRLRDANVAAGSAGIAKAKEEAVNAAIAQSDDNNSVP